MNVVRLDFKKMANTLPGGRIKHLRGAHLMKAISVDLRKRIVEADKRRGR
jgi:hypothetical protein